MKKILLTILPLLLIVGCSKPINESILIRRGELMYETNATKPFSGKVVGNHSNGKKAFVGTYKDGFRHGDWTHYTKVGDGKYSVTYTAGTFNMALFTDKLGTDYTGSPITSKRELGQDGTYLFQRNRKKYGYNLSAIPFGFVTTKDGKQDGLWTEWHENGEKYEEGTYKDGKEDGLWTWWYENGQKRREGKRQGYNKYGKWTAWHDNGKKKWEGSFNDGKKEGKWTYFYENGQKEEEGTYSEAHKIGKWTIWDENDGKKYEGKVIRKDDEDGTFLYWYGNVQKDSDAIDYNSIAPVSLVPDTPVMEAEEYEPGITIETYKDGERDGKWNSWYENRQKRYEVNYKSGNRIGSGLYYEEDGELKYEVKEPVTDIDGNSYKTIRIGGQVWMAENLKVTHYRNGDPISTGHSNSEWADLVVYEHGRRKSEIGTETGAYCVYNDQESNADTYGYLYNWYAVDDSRNIAPEGWHVPTDDEWQTLINYLGGGAGGKLKEAGTAHWNSPNTGSTNESGFTALPGGYRDDYKNDRGEIVGYDGMGTTGDFWYSTRNDTWGTGSRRLACCSWGRKDSHPPTEVYRSEFEKEAGFSIRCIRD